MTGASTPWWAWLLGFAFSAPWIILAVWYWRMTPKGDADLPPSMAERARRRLIEH